MDRRARTLAEITVIGPDRKGVVAGVTHFVFQSHGNIEKINQTVSGGLFGMHLEASFGKGLLDSERFYGGLKKLGRKLGMEIKAHFDEPTRLKNMAVFVTREPHCLEEILRAKNDGELKANVSVVVGSEDSLESRVRSERIPFVPVDYRSQAGAERRLIALMERYNVDLIVLARYMRILSPNFVWRFPNRIINIHPSLLPAFSGAYAYAQAFEKGAQIVGCTAHFVTEDLDQGPIIWQDSFRVGPREKLGSIRQRGQELEGRTLLNAIKLYLDNQLEVIWGKVQLKSRLTTTDRKNN